MAKKQQVDQATSKIEKTTAKRKSQAVAPKRSSVDSAQRLSVHGVVSYPDKSFADGVTVIAYDKDVAREDELGQATTDAQGAFHIPYTDAQFRRSKSESRGADVFVRVYNAKNELLGQSKTVRNARTNLQLNVRLPLNQFVVRGTVRGAGKGMLVQAFDKDLRGEELLGKDFTDAQENYAIPYQLKNFRHGERGTADIVVRAYPAHSRVPLSSDIYFNAALNQTIHLEITKGAALSEYERYLMTLKPVLLKVTLSKIAREKSEFREKDIDFLAGDTAIARPHLDWLVQAARIAEETLVTPKPTEARGRASKATGIPAPFFYGVFRQGLPTELRDLLKQDIQRLRAAVERAVEDKIIPPFSEREWSEIVKKLSALQTTLILRQKNSDQMASLGDLLETVGLSLNKQHIVADAYAQNNGVPSGEFWNALGASKEFSADEVNRVRLTFQFGAVTGNHLPLVLELQRRALTDAAVLSAPIIAPTMSSNRQAQMAVDTYGLYPLAELDVADWKAILETPQANGQPIGAPPTMAGDTPEEKINNYAVALNTYIENVLPTPVIASGLKKDTSDDSPFQVVKADLDTFFSNNPLFEFKANIVDVYLSDGLDQKLANVLDPGALKGQLKDMQRVFKVTPRFAAIRTLLADDLDSALSIAYLGERAFIAKYAESLGDAGKALEVYQKALQVHSTALTFYMRHAPAFNAPLPYVISGDFKKQPAPMIQDVAGRDLSTKTAANLTSLFGALDLCNCEDCESLYSPAAYFVDILKFLSEGTTNTGNNPLRLLFNRRPDLEHLELSCENTNTQLPYVDLALEILEANVTSRSFAFNAPMGFNLAATIAGLRGGTVPESFRVAFAANGYALSEKVSVRSDTQPMNWILLEAGWVFTLKILGANDGVLVFAWPQTSWTTEELTANPEHVQASAYTFLREEVYPWNLPLNLPMEEARVYLGHLGLPRHALMETFFQGTPSAALSDLEIACEYLGLTMEEANIITGSTTGGTAWSVPTVGAWNFWGLFEDGNDILDLSDERAAHAQGRWDAVLERVSIFLQQSGLSYRDLLELIGTYFINPATTTGRAIGIVSLDTTDVTTCKLSDLAIQVLDANIIDPRSRFNPITPWNRMHRFVRLWRKLGWTMRDLDKAIIALQPVPHQPQLGMRPPAVKGKLDITPSVLIQLSHIQRLRVATNLPVVNLLSWWRNIDTGIYIDYLADREPNVPSLYAQLFTNKTSTAPALDPDPAHLTGALSERVAEITAALQISVDDFALLCANANVIPLVQDPAHPHDPTKKIRDDALTLTNLSRLYRHATLAKACKLLLRSYLPTLALIDTEPFTTTADTVEFINQINKIRATGFSVEDLDYMLRHTVTPTSTLAVTDDTITAFMNVMRDNLRQVWTDNSFIEAATDANAATNDPNGELVRKKLALLNWDTTLIEQAIAVLNSAFTFETELAALAPSVVIPEALKSKLSYDSTAQKLRFIGTMTAAEKTRLVAPPNDTDNNFVAAIRTLFRQPKTFVARYLHRFAVPHYETALASLPVELKFPDALKNKIYYATDYETGIKKLNVIGIMTEAQRSALLQLSTEAAYRTAVQTLFDAPDNEIPSAQDTFLTVPRFEVLLNSLPTNLTFPASLGTKIYYDTVATKLRFHGVMTEAQRIVLSNLSADTNYKTAIQALFDAPDSGTPPTGAATDSDITTWFANATNTQASFLLVLRKLLPYLRTTLSERAVKQGYSEYLKLDSVTTDALLKQWVNAPAHPTQKAISEFLTPAFAASSPNVQSSKAAFPDQFNTVLLLQKISVFIVKFKITPPQLQWLFQYGQSANWLDFNLLPLEAVESARPVFRGWARLVELFQLRDQMPNGEPLLTNLFRTARAPGAQLDVLLDKLSAGMQWSLPDLTALCGVNGFNFSVGSFQDQAAFARLCAAFVALKRLGASADQCISWKNSAMTDIDARAIMSLVKAKYDPRQWLEQAQALRDPLRERQRSALVSYLVYQRGMRDANDLFSDLLIDVEMSPCMMTTRIKQAINSVQLFVQRCYMNLEQGVALTPTQVREWSKWLKQNQEWQANREILLYTENWIEPDLRDDKSPFFQALENELLQNDVTMDTAEDAMLHYLEKLDQVARLEIIGIYLQEAENILHVVGRTYAIPHIYFYRQLAEGVWSAWERMDLDIEGDHLIPIAWNRRLYLFWSIFNKKSEPPTKTERQNEEDPLTYWEIKLAWSEYKNKTWSPKRVSKQALRNEEYAYLPSDTLSPYSTTVPNHPSISVPQEPEDFSFKTRFVKVLNGEQLRIECYGKTARSVLIPPAPAPTTTPPPVLTTFLSALVPQAVYVPFQNQSVLTFLKCRFLIDGAKPTRAQRDHITLKIRSSQTNPQGETLGLNANGIVYSSRAYAEVVLFDLVSDEFQISSVVDEGSWWMPFNPAAYAAAVIEAGFDAVADRGITLSVSPIAIALVVDPLVVAYVSSVFTVPFIEVVIPAVTGLVSQINAAASIIFSAAAFTAIVRLFGRAMTVTLKTIPPPPPIAPAVPVYDSTIKLMQGIGEFTLDDCNGELVAVAFADVVPALDPPTLTVLPNTEIKGMQLVEASGEHPFITPTSNSYNLTIFGNTPGMFRLLGSPHDGTFTVAAPFFFQDGQRTYFVSWKADSGPFAIAFHPRVCDFIHALNRDGIRGVLTLENQRLDDLGRTFQALYAPAQQIQPPDLAPKENVDFTYQGAYALYNWELFFHIPFLTAIHLSKNQHFEDAQKWFHYIFDPTATDSFANPADPGPERFWRVMPFYEEAQHGVQTLTGLLAQDSEFDIEVAAWRANPFKPHVIARLRVVAYMKAVVMRYIDNLLAWGDQLFRRDTIESINQATQLYILAAQILGRHPENIPARAQAKLQTYRTLDDRSALNSLSNALVEIEAYLPPSAAPVPTGDTTSGMPLMPFFCIPGNDKLLGYWDTVAGRLNKVRHCMNIDGVVRVLPIFEPRVDPALFVRAAAAGVDLDSVLNDLNAPLPHYRFSVLQQKATELCNDVKALGAALLSALEKKDGEELALLRSGHEVALLTAIRDIKQKQVEEATNTLAGLNKYAAVVTLRQQYYQNREFMNPYEMTHMNLATSSLIPMSAQIGAEITAAVLHLIPDAKLGFFTTVGATYGGANIASAIQATGSAAGSLASMLNTMGSLSSTLGGYQRRQDDWTHQANLATKELEQVAKQIAAAEIRLAITEAELENHDLQIQNTKQVDEFMHSKYTNQELCSWMIGQLSAIYFQSYQLAYDVAKRVERTYRFELGLTDSDFIQFGYWDSLKKGLLAGERLQYDLKRMDVSYLDLNKREYEITKHVSLLLHDPMALMTLKETDQCEFDLPETLFDMDYPGQYMRRLKSVSLSIPCVTGQYTSINCTLTLLKSKTRIKSLPSAPYVESPNGNDNRFFTNFGVLQSIATSHAQNDSGLFELNFRDERYLPFEGSGAISRWRIEMPKESNAFELGTIADVVLHLKYTARDGGETLKTDAQTAIQNAIQDTVNKPLTQLFSLKHEFPTEWYRFLHPVDAAATVQTLPLNLTVERFPFQFRGKPITVSKVDLFLKLKDVQPPQSNQTLTEIYAAGAPETHLKLFLRSLGDGTLIGDLSLLRGIPHTIINLAVAPIPALLHLEVNETGDFSVSTIDLALRETVGPTGATHQRLKVDAIEDLWMVCHYSVND